MSAPRLLGQTAEKAAEKTVIGEIQVVGGATITVDTVEYYLGVSKGDDFNEDLIKQGFRKFWDSGLVEDLRIEFEDMEPGHTRIIVSLRERPKVTEFIFKGNKKYSATTIREKLDSAGVTIRRMVPLRGAEIQRMRQALIDAYAKDGYASVVVDPKISEVGPNQRKVTFQIDEGAKVRIGGINYIGNKVYPTWRLRAAMKKVKRRALWRPFGKKLIWSRESWGEDSENLKKFYMNRGYKDIVVGEPKVELIARNPEGATQKKKRFRTIITIPIDEGKRFRMGTLKLTGLTVFKEEVLRKYYYTREGKYYNHARIEEGNEALRNLYNGRGYIYAYTNPALTEREKEPGVVDVEINVFEGDRFRVGRIEFSGNTKTQDKVIRREFLLYEGDYMNMPLFRRSVFKINQLGYFKLKEDPVELSFDPEKKLVNAVVKGEEIGRTDVQFGAGYSERDGFFGQAMFNTRNFMGRGEVLGLSGQVGKRVTTYSLSFQEPYFLDKRMLIGGSIFKQKMQWEDLSYTQNSTSESKGLSLMWGVSLGAFTQLSVQYGWQDTFARFQASRTVGDDGPAIPRRRPLDPPHKDILPEEASFQEQKGKTSSITPSFGSDSRDDPFDPSQGKSYFTRVAFAGGILKGDYSFVRPEAGISFFHPITRRYIFAANFEAGFIKGFGGKDIPWFNRYTLGGETSMRGFEYNTVVPRKPNGDYIVDKNGFRLWGDRYLQINLEYQVKVGGPVKFILFTDIGNAWHESQGWDFRHLRYGTGAELRITLPIFQAPLRFIYGINLKPFKDEKRSDFNFSIGTTF